MIHPMHPALTTFTTLPRAALLIAAACLGSLGFALIMQYGFDVHPCHLCLWQRVPFVIGALAGIAAWALRAQPTYARAVLLMAAAAFLANTGLALFHSGVERHWWEWQSACTGGAMKGLSADALRQALLGTPVVRCDEISWTLFGLSMANWNAPFSLGLSLLALLSTRQKSDSAKRS